METTEKVNKIWAKKANIMTNKVNEKENRIDNNKMSAAREKLFS